ncbi:putative pendrin isoform X3 [Apostichopus japonicus]|uniref:Putative pendrin isoform X3 n=1 Tax=Stichopus japonicus TaxID=307972 RepID=A0A2G8JQ72_STIJA|nr:putative pendrin isoform X3 [Apostichopus japonicus]
MAGLAGQNCDQPSGDNPRTVTIRANHPHHQLDGSQLTLRRPIYNERTFSQKYPPQQKSSKSAKDKLRGTFSSDKWNLQTLKNFFYGIVPIAYWLPRYQIKSDLFEDCLAGLTVGVLRIPHGMAHAVLATLPPVYGLYTNIFPQLIYAVFGTSRHVSIGTMAVISIMVGDAVEKAYQNIYGDEIKMNHPPEDEETERARIASTLALMVGLIQFLMCLLRVGIITNYLPEPLVRGFTTGAACHVFSSQFNHLFGIELDRYIGPFSLIKTYKPFLLNLGLTNPTTLLISFSALLILIFVKEFQDCIRDRFKWQLPVEMLVVVLGTLFSHLFNFEDKKVAVVGQIPNGSCLHSELHTFFLQPFIVTNDVITLSYIACRSNVHSARTACHSVYREIPLTVTGMLFGSHYVGALRGMFRQLTDIKKLWKYSKIDMTIWVVTFVFTVLMGLDIGLAIGIGYSIFTVILRSQWPQSCMLGQFGETGLYGDMKMFPDAKCIPGIKIFRIQSPLFFANAAYLKKALVLPSLLSTVVQPAEQNQTKEHSRNIDNLHRYTSLESTVGHNSNDVMLNHVIAHDSNHHSVETAIGDSNDRSDGCLLRTLIVDMSGVSFVDTVALNTLESIAQDYLAANAKVYLAECRSNVKHMLFTSGLVKSIDLEHIFLSVHDAVLHSQSMRVTNQAKSLDPEHPLTIEEFEVADSAC